MSRESKSSGATLTPFDGEAQSSRGYFSPEKEKIRAAVNDFIRNGKAYDAVVDFDKAVRDPKSPNHILAAYDSGDSLHPNDAGYKAMGDAIDLSVFKDSRQAAEYMDCKLVGKPVAADCGHGTDADAQAGVRQSDGARDRSCEPGRRYGPRGAFERVRDGAAEDRRGPCGAERGRGRDRGGFRPHAAFGGKASVAIPPGAVLLSDPVSLKFRRWRIWR